MGFALDRSGLARFLGQREADIMEILWREGALSGKDVRFQLRLKQKLAATTVLTLLTRLVEKGRLTRHKERQSYLYQPTKTREKFIADCVGEIVTALERDFPKELRQVLNK